jgi:hypothetical protein
VSAKSICKDLGLGLVIASVLAVVAIRAIELYARSHVAAERVQAEERLSAGRAYQPCVADS